MSKSDESCVDRVDVLVQVHNKYPSASQCQELNSLKEFGLKSFNDCFPTLHGSSAAIDV